jgi:ABC-type glycerol-3-phosphate transport system substrate-binding protein
VFAFILALLVLSACGAAELAAAEIRTAAVRYVLDDIELSGIPAVCGGAVYDCSGDSCTAVWPKAGTPLDAPEGFRATSLCSGSEGGVWTLDIYWDEDYAEHIELCLHRLEGGCETFEDGWLGGVTDMCWSDGALWLACADGYVRCLSEDFKLLLEYELEDVMGLAATGSGVNLKYREKAGVTFANLSTDGSLTPGPAALTEDCVLQDALGGWLWTDTRGLVRDTDSGAEYIVLWADSGLVFSAASLWVAELGDGLYAAYDGSAAGVLRPATEADTEQPERVTLTLAHMDENSYIPSYIDEFNRTHSDIRVELLPEMPHEALVALMASDEAPDIIGFGYNSPESMASKGWLLDMYTLMGDFPREDFLLEPFETDGALYAVSPEYYVYTLVGLEADFGRSYIHPISDFEGIGFNYFAGDEFLTYSIPLWIEHSRQGADCDFGSPEFTELLEMAGSMNKAESFSPDTLSVSVLTNHMALINTEKERGLELWPVGFPGGSYISPIAAMGIHAATPEPEAAWEFIRWCIAQRENFFFSLNMTAMEEMFYELLHPHEDLDPEKVVIREDGTWDYEGRHYETLFSWEPSITERQADMMLGLVKSLDTVIYYDAEIDDIISEDAGAFLSGARSVEDTAALLGDRLGTYLAEKYG